MTNVDLKIAEALEIDEAYQHGKSGGKAVFPSYHVNEHGVTIYRKSAMDKGFIFDLDGPDAGNTADAIKALLAEQNYTIDERAVKLPDGVIYGCWIQRQPEIPGTEIHDIFEAHAKTAPLALRGALVKKFNIKEPTND